ncbi:MAG: hypothetical protein FJ090_01920 [Deltaproteobacteria bacterium]|nr:hypothetical protein [Deltaproteobacteria bacterium]
MLVLVACRTVTEVVTSAPDSAVDTGAIDDGDSAVDSGGDSGVVDSGDSGSGGPGPVEWPEAGPACESWGEAEQTGTVVDVELEEISGLVVSFQNPGVLWVLEDHGNPADIVAIDPAGNTIATLTLEVEENVDWEELILAPCGTSACLVVVDAGDNSGARDALALLVVEEPVLDGVTTELTALPDAYGFTYPEAPENCEAAAMAPDGRFFLYTKRPDNTAGVYVLPAYEDAAVASVVGDIPTGPEEDPGPQNAATGASFWPDGSRLLLRTYTGSLEYLLPGGPEKLDAVSFTPLPTPPIDHIETIAYDVVNRGYWTIPEAMEGAPIFWVPCLD